jgi:formate dehydrogenase beta subunit
MSSAHDLTPLVDPTWEHGSGAVRTRQPCYVSLLAPCNNACPAGEDVQACWRWPRRAVSRKRG